MNELQSIIRAFGQARDSGLRAALCTVVQVEGSAYRRPGARMLITEEGQTTGSISGGCLERDVALRALGVIESRSAITVEYDTRGDEDIVWGLGVGCNGVVRVLIESLREESAGRRALKFMADCMHERKSGVIATVIQAYAGSFESGAKAYEIGERLLLYREPNECASLLEDASLDQQRIREAAQEILASEQGAVRSFENHDVRAEIFFDVIKPPMELVICGAEHDALPLLHLARTLGWRVTVVDVRSRRATLNRFAEADEVLLCAAEDLAAHLSLSESMAVVIMTHNYLFDVELLRALLPSPVRYLGILGPKQRTLKLLEEIEDDLLGLSAAEFTRLHSPVGVDIGAETPEEIAVSIICEIKAVCSARRGGFLRDRNAPIHGDAQRPAKVSAQATASESVPLVACQVS